MKTKLSTGYRLSSHIILQLLSDLKDDLEPVTQRSHAIPAVVKLLSILHYLASGSFQGTVAAVAGISQSAFSRALPVVLNAFLR